MFCLHRKWVSKASFPTLYLQTPWLLDLVKGNRNHILEENVWICLTTKSESDPINCLFSGGGVNVSNIPAPIDFSLFGVSGQRRSVYSNRWSWNRSPAIVLWDLGPGPALWTIQKELPRSRCVQTLRTKGRVWSHLPRRKQSCRRMLVNQITKISLWVFIDDSQVKIFPPGVLPLSSQ